MKIDVLDPLLDPRWQRLVASHPSASVFHTSGWLKALARTYGFRPVALTSTAAGKLLSDGVVFCEVRSGFTGARLISLPFSDHCQPLFDGASDGLDLEQWMEGECARGKWKYLELRPIAWDSSSGSTLVATETYWLHTLDLAPSIERIFRNTHKSCFQRRVRHAEHENLVYERSATDRLVDDFYKLLIITRKRHMLLPQPREWFQNLMTEMHPNAEIRVARKDGVPVAAILTLRHRGTTVYKYGCSDARFHRLGGIPFLFWRLIEESKLEGVEQIDFGRTELENTGLTEFKDRIGTTRVQMSNLRYPKSEQTSGVQLSRMGGERKLISFLPNVVSSTMGRLVYRHIA